MATKKIATRDGFGEAIVEAGKANPTLETLASLAEGCGKRLRVTLE